MKINSILQISLTGILLASTTSAQLIISDDFNIDDTSDINASLNTRQAGTQAGTSWITNSNGIYGIINGRLDAEVTSPVDSGASLDYDFATNSDIIAAKGFTVSFDMTPTDGSYSAFSIGASSPIATRPVISSNTDIGLLMEDDGRLAIFANGTNVSDQNGAITWTGGGSLDFVELTILTENFNASTSFTISMTVAGSTIDLDPDTPSTSLTSTWDGGKNYLVFSNRGVSSSISDNFDNFNVSTVAIPEPKLYSIFIGLSIMLTALNSRRRIKI